MTTFSMKGRDIRIMACCLNTGEAAGIAAAMTATDSADTRAVNTGELRRKLKAHGAFLPDMHLSRPDAPANA